MKTTKITYTVKPERVDEHISLVKAVFDELHRVENSDISYRCFLINSKSFMHIAGFENEAASIFFTNLPSFKAFRKDFDDRVAEKPVSLEIVEIGAYF